MMFYLKINDRRGTQDDCAKTLKNQMCIVYRKISIKIRII